jgi:hypothetical protein
MPDEPVNLDAAAAGFATGPPDAASQIAEMDRRAAQRQILGGEGYEQRRYHAAVTTVLGDAYNRLCADYGDEYDLPIWPAFREATTDDEVAELMRSWAEQRLQRVGLLP